MNAVTLARKRVQSQRYPRTGAVCDVDPELFKAGCRAPLYPGQWNRWILAVSDEFGSRIGTPSQEERLTAVFKQVCDWFRNMESEHFYEGCDATEIAVRQVVRGTDIVATWGQPTASWDRCDTQVTVETPWTVYQAEFVYRGTRKFMPWPAWKEDLIGWSWCPLEASLAVMNVYEGSALSTPVVDDKGQVIEKGRPPSKDQPKKGLIWPILGNPSVPWGWITLGVVGIVVANKVLR